MSFFATLRKWKHKPEDLPWLDQPGAEEKIAALQNQNKITRDQSALLRHWTEHGYVVLNKFIPDADIDAFNTEFDSLWTAKQPMHGVEFDNLREEESGPVRNMPHTEVLAFSPEKRQAIRKRLGWRMHGMHEHLSAARSIFSNTKLRDISDLILGKKTEPRYSISFYHGSCQELHQDLVVFHIHPRNFLIGAWIALEDVTADAGPLVFYPGSHREQELFPEYDNYPQTSLHTATNDGAKRYQTYLQDLSRRYERKTFLAKKGDVFLWHSMMIHGGDKVLNLNSTRRSFVVHYVGQGCDVMWQIAGPFRW